LRTDVTQKNLESVATASLVFLVLAVASSAQLAREVATNLVVLPADGLPSDFGVNPPAGLFPIGVEPRELDSARFALGRALFFDPVLSIDRSVSCASCHQPEHGFADPRPISPGIQGASTVRHTPSLLNRGWAARSRGWARPRACTSRSCCRSRNPREMGLPLDEIAPRLRADPRHGPAFEAAFGRPATIADTGEALSAFVERIWSSESPVDRFQAGDFDALTRPRARGACGCTRARPAAGAVIPGATTRNEGLPRDRRRRERGHGAARGASP
jgi:cytochrome c peroxidase